MIQFDECAYFSNGLGNQPPTTIKVLFEKYVATWNHLKIRKTKKTYSQINPNLGGGFKYVLFSPRNLGKISNLTNILQMGWFNHQSIQTLSIFLPKTQSSRPKKRKRTKTTVGDLRDQPTTSGSRHDHNGTFRKMAPNIWNLTIGIGKIDEALEILLMEEVGS